jgi:hypothetical protein
VITTPFYKKALELFTRTQKAQIQKGLDKYPEPFNPHSWSPDELLNHALEETVDLTHYLVGLKDQLDVLTYEKRQLQNEVRRLKTVLGHFKCPEKVVRNLKEEGKFPTLPDILEDEPLSVLDMTKGVSPASLGDKESEFTMGAPGQMWGHVKK